MKKGVKDWKKRGFVLLEVLLGGMLLLFGGFLVSELIKQGSHLANFLRGTSDVRTIDLYLRGKTDYFPSNEQEFLAELRKIGKAYDPWLGNYRMKASVGSLSPEHICNLNSTDLTVYLPDGTRVNNVLYVIWSAPERAVSSANNLVVLPKSSVYSVYTLDMYKAEKCGKGHVTRECDYPSENSLVAGKANLLFYNHALMCKDSQGWKSFNINGGSWQYTAPQNYGYYYWGMQDGYYHYVPFVLERWFTRLGDYEFFVYRVNGSDSDTTRQVYHSPSDRLWSSSPSWGVRVAPPQYGESRGNYIYFRGSWINLQTTEFIADPRAYHDYCWRNGEGMICYDYDDYWNYWGGWSYDR